MIGRWGAGEPRTRLFRRPSLSRRGFLPRPHRDGYGPACRHLRFNHTSAVLPFTLQWSKWPSPRRRARREGVLGRTGCTWACSTAAAPGGSASGQTGPAVPHGPCGFGDHAAGMCRPFHGPPPATRQPACAPAFPRAVGATRANCWKQDWGGASVQLRMQLASWAPGCSCKNKVTTSWCGSMRTAGAVCLLRSSWKAGHVSTRRVLPPPTPTPTPTQAEKHGARGLGQRENRNKAAPEPTAQGRKRHAMKVFERSRCPSPPTILFRAGTFGEFSVTWVPRSALSFGLPCAGETCR